MSFKNLKKSNVPGLLARCIIIHFLLLVLMPAAVTGQDGSLLRVIVYSDDDGLPLPLCQAGCPEM